MKRAENKSDCPVNHSAEIFGDAWSLLIVRDIAALGKKTYGEFLESEERIGSSVLADRLLHLERHDIIAKKTDEHDRRRVIYTLTTTGMCILPLLYEYATWNTTSYVSSHDPWVESTRHDKALVMNLWRDALDSGSSFMTGPNSVVSKLKLV